MRKNKNFNLLEVHVSGKSVLLKAIEIIESPQWLEEHLMVRSNRQNELFAFFSLWQIRNGCVIDFEVQLCNYPFDIDEIEGIRRDLINKLKSLADNFESYMQQYSENYYFYGEKFIFNEGLLRELNSCILNECLDG